MTATVAQKAALKLAILVYKEESPRGGVSWTARCVLTGGIAEGLTEESAIENLRRGVDAALWMAAKFGMSPREWYETQEPDEPEYLAAFCRLVPRGIRTVTLPMGNAACEVEATIAVGHAA